MNMTTRYQPTSHHRIRRGVLAALVCLGATACGGEPSEQDRTMAAQRAALATQQNEVVAGESACSEIHTWRETHQAEIAASDAWWSALGGSMQSTLREEYPAIGTSGQSRGRLLIQCGSAGALWDSGS